MNRLHRIAVAALALGLVSCSGEEQPKLDMGAAGAAGGRREVASTSLALETPINAAADTFIRKLDDDSNYGSLSELRVEGTSLTGYQHGLVRFNNSAITGALGTNTLVKAELELTINHIPGFYGDGMVTVHRMTMAWTENGATWDCANDTATWNFWTDCALADRWGFDWGDPYPQPYVTAATDGYDVAAFETGAIRFDVTDDVEQFLATPTSNKGWLIKATQEPYIVKVHFKSRETTAKPRLIITHSACGNGVVDPGEDCDDGTGINCGAGSCGPGDICTRDLACTTGSCAFGIAAQFGLPPAAGVCWTPDDCATMHPTTCGTTSDLCPCCIPSCGAAGTMDECGGTCQPCVPGADSDRDGISDCDERNDGDSWTDPLVFNGVIAERGPTCHLGPTCAAIDTLAEVNACFAPVEDRRLQSGWDFATADQNICQPGFGFAPNWTGCSEDFGVHYRAGVRLAQTGFHCFAVNGGTIAQCGSLFFNGAAVVSQGGATCHELPAGVYDIEWFYETTSNGTNELHIDYCFSANGPCTPTDKLPSGDLRPPDDSGERVCTEDSECSEVCPCGPGKICDDDLDCAFGFDCRFDVAPRFNLPPGTGVCWDSISCDDTCSELFECGSPSALCGNCPSCTPECSGLDCGCDGCFSSCGDKCGENENGCESDSDCEEGLVCIRSECVPEVCAHPGLDPCSDPANAGLETECGTCPACENPCEGRICGIDPRCEVSCGPDPGPGLTCTADGQIAALLQVDFGRDVPVDGADTPGTLPGELAVSDLGQAVYTIPLRLPPGRNGIEPDLALTYSSAASNGYVGMGWSIRGLSAIQRCPRTMAQDGEPAGIRYTDDDRFCLDGQRLVLEDEGDEYGADGTAYRTEIESFSRIVSEGTDDEPRRFVVYTRDGRIMTYGKRIGGNTPLTDKGIRNPNYEEGQLQSYLTQTWALSEVRDRFGNRMNVEYWVPYTCIDERVCVATAHGPIGGGSVREYYPSRIYYTSNDDQELHPDRVVDFNFSKRNDILYGYQYGVLFERTHKLDSIVASANGQTVFTYKLSYDEPQTDAEGDVPSEELHKRTLLTSVQQCGRRTIEPTPDGEEEQETCKPPTRFEYSIVEPGFEEPTSVDVGVESIHEDDASFVGAPLTLDIDGNGQDDVLFPKCASYDGDGRCSGALQYGLILNGAEASNLLEDPDRMVVDGDHDEIAASVFVTDYDLDGRDDVFEIDVAYGKGVGGQIARVWKWVQLEDLGVVRIEPANLPAGQPFKSGMAYMADANGDGAADLVVCSPVGKKSKWQLFLHDSGPGGLESPDTVTNDGPACFGGNAIDLNGDGRHELLLNTRDEHQGQSAKKGASDIFWPLTGEKTAAVLPALKANDVRLLLDTNGDGLRDALDFDGELEMELWINTGTGFRSEFRDDLNLSSISGHYSNADFISNLPKTAAVYDENGDGRDDLLIRVGPSAWRVLRAHGKSVSLESLPSGINLDDGNRLIVYDANDDGVRDLREIDQLWIKKGAPVQWLIAITDGLEARSEIRYSHLTATGDGIGGEGSLAVYPAHSLEATDGCEYPCYRRYPAGFAVRMVRHFDEVIENPDPDDLNMPWARMFVHSYIGARLDLQGRGSLGFLASIGVDNARHGDQFTSRRQVRTYARQAFRDAERGLYPFAGMVTTSITSATTAAGRNRIEMSTRELLANDSEADDSVFPHVQLDTQTIRECTGSLTCADEAILQQVERHFEYDPFGNLTRFEERFAEGDTNETVTDYVTDSEHEDRWLISQPREETRVSERGEQDRRVKRFVYAEDPEAAMFPAHMQYTGKPAQIVIEPDDEAQTLTTTYLYSGAGNAEEITVTGRTIGPVDTRGRTMEYDEYQMVPVLLTENGHETEVQYDHALSLAVGTIEEGLRGDMVRRHAFTDGFGRMRRLYDADNTVTEIEYLPRPAAEGGITVRRARAGAPEKTLHYDVRNREERRDFDGLGGELHVDTTYNGLGLVASVTRAVSGSADPGVTTFSYDAFGRPLVTALPDAPNTIERCYTDNVVCVRNARHRTSCQVFNNHGELAYSVDPIEGSQRSCAAVIADVVEDFPADGTPAADTDFPASRYTYGTFRTVSSIFDPAGNETSFDYDDYARVIRREDPDAGTWQYRYNAFGEREVEIDGENDKAVFRYDVLGRLVSRTDVPAGGADDAPGDLTEWKWDFESAAPDAEGFYGKLRQSSTPGNVVNTSLYDESGRLKTFSKEIPGDGDVQTLTRVHDYEEGRLMMLTYESTVEPGNPMRVRFGYNANGYLARLSQPDPSALTSPEQDTSYWQVLAADPYGQLELERFGDDGDELETARTYEPLTGTLDTLVTVRSGGGPTVQSWSFDYDENRNLKQRTNLVGSGDVTDYLYDSMDRFRRATTTEGGEGTPELFVEDYTYDETGLGNIQTRTVSDPGAMMTFTHVYDYGTESRPHAVKFIRDEGGNELREYRYDSNGNIDFRDTGPSLQTIDYNRLRLPSHMQAATVSIDLDYDAEGTRVRKQDPGGTETFYLDDFYSRSRTSPGSSGFRERLVIAAGNRGVAEVIREPGSPPTQTTRFLHADHLGSVEVVTDPAGPDLVIERRRYEAFGKRRSVDPEAPFGTRYDFAGHEFDSEFGLINMKARMYDPELGRFMAPDPIMADPGWSQGLNPYSYVNNNPLNAVDPTGRWSLCLIRCLGEAGWGIGLRTNDGDGLGFGVNDNGQAWGAFISGSGNGLDDNSGLTNRPNDTFRPSDGDFAQQAPTPNQRDGAKAEFEIPDWLTYTLLGVAVAAGIGALADAIDWEGSSDEDSPDSSSPSRESDAAPRAKGDGPKRGGGESSWSGYIPSSLDVANWLDQYGFVDAAGFQLEFSFIQPWTSGGGGSYGINFEYTKEAGWGLYGYGTPVDQPSEGFLLGPSFTFNVATGNGDWSGPFKGASGSYGPVTGGYFETANPTPGQPGYFGFQLGLGKGPPGVGRTTTNYTLW